MILKFQEKSFLIGNVKIPFDGIGIWYHIFINSTTQASNIIWYSNFKLLMNQSLSHVHSVDLLKEDYIKMEYLNIGDISDFLYQCHQQ